jgi:hypothetical protein
MLTDDQLATRIGPRLRDELAGLPVPDMLTALRRRRARRARVTAAVTVAVAAPVAAVAALSATLPGGTSAAAHPAGRHVTALGGTVITLDGYSFGIPAQFRVVRLGAGFEASGPGITHMTIFVESFARSLPLVRGVPVSVGSRPGWWSGQRGAGELLIPLPSRHGADYLVTKALGPSVSENVVVSFASHIDFGSMRVVDVACPPDCG